MEASLLSSTFSLIMYKVWSLGYMYHSNTHTHTTTAAYSANLGALIGPLQVNYTVSSILGAKTTFCAKLVCNSKAAGRLKLGRGWWFV